MNKTERLQIRMTPELKELLSKAAAKEHRTVSNYVELLLLREIGKSVATDNAEANNKN